MDVRQMLNLIEITFDKPMKETQRMVYLDKLSVIPDRMWPRIEQEITETCKRFPSLAEVFMAAKECGWQRETNEYKPHVWTPTDCQLCKGSGLVAAFWSQEFEITEQNKAQILRLHYVLPYHDSAEYNGRKDHDDVRAVYRCFCDAGAAETLSSGIPRWRENMPETIKRGWAA